MTRPVGVLEEDSLHTQLLFAGRHSCVLGDLGLDGRNGVAEAEGHVQNLTVQVPLRLRPVTRYHDLERDLWG